MAKKSIESKAREEGLQVIDVELVRAIAEKLGMKGNNMTMNEDSKRELSYTDGGYQHSKY